MPLISIIMNCHNAGEYLPQALDSVRKQTLKDYEIIFWDNQSTDNSAALALAYGKPLRYFKSDTFLPLGEARNRAIGQASGEYIAILDCDDIWLPGKLEKQMSLFRTEPDLQMVYSDAYVTNAQEEIKGTYFQTHKPHSGNILAALLAEGCFISCETVMFQTKAFRTVGGFRADLNIAEDYDLFLRLAQRYEVSYVPEPLTKWREHQASFSKRFKLQGKRETINVIYDSVNLLDKISRTQAQLVRRRFTRLCGSLILEHWRRRKLISIPLLTLELLRKYLSLSARLSAKTIR